MPIMFKIFQNWSIWSLKPTYVVFVLGVNDFRKTFYTWIHVWHHLKIKSNWKYNLVWPKKILANPWNHFRSHFTFKCFSELLTPHTLLSYTHQPHFSSSPYTNLNSTHSPTLSSGCPAKPRPDYIVPPPPSLPSPRSRCTIEIAPQHRRDRTHSTSSPCSTIACLRSTIAIITPAIIQATLLYELKSTSKLLIYSHNPIPILANPYPPCPIHTHLI